MADAMLERRPALRFFCHRCLVEFQHVAQNYVCPYCEGGFVELLEGDSEALLRLPSEDYSDADMSNIDDMNVDDMGLDDSDDFSISTPPMLNDLAFLMSGGRIRAAVTSRFTANGIPISTNIFNGPLNVPTNLPNNGPTNMPNNGPPNAPGNGPTNVPNNGPTDVPNSGSPSAPSNVPPNAPANAPPNAPTNGPANGNVPVPANGNNTGNTNLQRGPTLMEELLWMISGGRPPTGAMTAGAPFVLVGTPGDYVFGGEGLDAVVTQLLGQLEHSGPPPLPRDRLANLPTEEVTEEQAATNTACSVCWENFQLGETVSRLECEHVFHKSCITPWLELHATCPICRRSLLPPPDPTAPPAPQPPTPPNTATTHTAFTPPAFETQHIRLHAGPLSSLFVNTTPHIVIQRRTGRLPTLIRRIPSQTHTWDSLNDTSTSGSMSPASSVTAGGVWASQNRSSNSSGSTNSSSSLNSNDRDRQYNTDIDFD